MQETAKLGFAMQHMHDTRMMDKRICSVDRSLQLSLEVSRGN